MDSKEERIYACYELSFSGVENGENRHLMRLESLDFKILENLVHSDFSNQVILKTDSLLDFRSEIMKFIHNLTLILFGREVKKESEAVFCRFGFKPERDSEQTFSQFLKSHELSIANFQEMLLFDAFSIIESEKEIRDKEEKKIVLEEFVKEIGEAYWNFFYFKTTPEVKIDMIQALSEKLIRLLYSVHLGDYLSLLFMELAQNAEKAHYEYLAEKELSVQAEQVSRFIKEKSGRETLQSFIRQHDDFLETEFLFLQENDFHKMRITLNNLGLLEGHVAAKLEEKMNQGMSDQSLGEFFEESSNLLGAGLGLFYASYLKEECDQQGFIFDSAISYSAEEKKVSATLEFMV